jgi:circadian clock protein KaiB
MAGPGSSGSRFDTRNRFHAPEAMGNRRRRRVTESVLRLYIAGTSATARRAEQQLADLQTLITPEWRVEVIDVLLRPELAEKAGILATPTLSYEHPERSRRIVGDLGDAKRVLEFLGIEKKGKPA